MNQAATPAIFPFEKFLIFNEQNGSNEQKKLLN